MKYYKIIWVILAAFMFASCSTSQQLQSEDGIVEGTIYSISNEPFTKLGIQTSDGTMYILKCTTEIEKVLNTRQGKKVKVYYEKTEQTPEGLTLKVVKIEYPPYTH